MKTLLAALCLLAIAGCKEEETDECKLCTMNKEYVVVPPSSAYPSNVTESVILCDDSLRYFENKTRTEVINGTHTVTITINTHCN